MNFRQNKYVTDSTPVLLLSVAFFILPAKMPSIFRWAEDKGKIVISNRFILSSADSRISQKLISQGILKYQRISF